MELIEILDLVRWGLLFAAVIYSAYTDMVQGRVSNTVSFGGMAAGLGLHYAAHGWSAAAGPALLPGLACALSGLAWGLGLFVIPYALGGLSAGDVKLMGAVGALGGYPFILPAIFFTVTAGAVLALSVLIWKGRLLAGLGRSLRLLLHPKSLRATNGLPGDERTPINYAVAIAVGSVAAFIAQALGP